MKQVVDVELEIGENLFLRIDNVSYVAGEPAYTSGLPEDCHDGSSAEVDWKSDDAKLVYKQSQIDMTYAEMMEFRKMDKPFKYKIVEHEFPVPDDLAVLYYDQIIDYIEEV